MTARTHEDRLGARIVELEAERDRWKRKAAAAAETAIQVTAENVRLTVERDVLRPQAAIGAWVQACTVSDDEEVLAPDGYGYVQAHLLRSAALAECAPVSGDPT